MTQNYLDSRAYMELVIMHMIRDGACCKRAKELNVTPDLFGDSETGIREYREFADIALEINDSPIDPGLFMGQYEMRLNAGRLSPSRGEEYLQLILNIYNSKLNCKYVLETLPEFVKKKKTDLLQAKYKTDPDEFVKEYSKLAIEIRLSKPGVEHKKRLSSPMDIYVPSPSINSIPTGLQSIDADIGGLGIGELGFVLGGTGAGKSTIAIVLAKNAAGLGKKVLYVSLEESGVNINERFISSLLNESYSNLHKGLTDPKIIQDKIDAFPRKTEYFSNLKVLDLKEEAPLTVAELEEIVVTECKSCDFWPDLIIVDQMDYVNCSTKFNSEWEKYQRMAFDLDSFSHTLLAGIKPFALYVLHQLGGKIQFDYTIDNIASFKGVLKPADLAMFLGRKGVTSSLIKLESFKVRHGKNFSHRFTANFENMTIIENLKQNNPYVKFVIPNSCNNNKGTPTDTLKIIQKNGN